MTKQDIKPGSAPLRSRDERFAQLVADADGGQSRVESWVQSDPAEVKPEITPGRRVSASKAGKRCADRIAYLKQQNTSTAPTERLTAHRLTALMEEVTRSLMSAADSAQKAGSHSIAQILRKSITVHAGRSERVDRRSPTPARSANDIDVTAMVERLYYCTCPCGPVLQAPVLATRPRDHG